MSQDPEHKATPFEVLGAWLHLTTPPRGVVIPPVPWRKLALGAGVVVVILGVALAVLVPRINDTKDRNAAEYAAYKAKVERDRADRALRNQRASFGAAATLAPADGASAAEVQAARAELVDRLKTDMYADVKARGRSGEIKPPTAPPTCERTPGSPSGGDYGVFDCFVQTSPVAADQKGALGYPFRAVVHYDTFKYAWCRTEPVPSDNLAKGVDPNAGLLPQACQKEQ